MAEADDMNEPESEETEGDEPEGSDDSGSEDDPYAQAGETIRMAIDEKDDAGIAQAICDLMDLHRGHSEPDGDEGPGAPPKKPSLAVIIANGRKKGS